MAKHEIAEAPSGVPLSCPVCEGEAHVVTTRQPGYQRPNVFSIAHCEHCGAAHAIPLETSAGLYDLIYSRAALIPGYDRYAHYADKVTTAADPLRYLANQEDVYWSIARYLAGKNVGRIGPVLEVGCGFGYLTYALRRHGLDARGIDLSREAIERAKERYGPYYGAEDVRQLAKKTPGSFSLVVMTEVIEHLPDFYSVMDAVAALLNVDGEAIITTPNRSVYAAATIWETDPPPVHLWWFTEKSIVEIARRIGLEVRFVDFSSLNATEPALLPTRDGGRITRPAMLDEHGALLVRSGPVRRLLPVGRIYNTLARSRSRSLALIRRVTRTPDPLAGRRGTMCAVFSRSTSEAGH